MDLLPNIRLFFWLFVCFLDFCYRCTSSLVNQSTLTCILVLKASFFMFWERWLQYAFYIFYHRKECVLYYRYLINKSMISTIRNLYGITYFIYCLSTEKKKGFDLRCHWYLLKNVNVVCLFSTINIVMNYRPIILINYQSRAELIFSSSYIILS